MAPASLSRLIGRIVQNTAHFSGSSRGDDSFDFESLSRRHQQEARLARSRRRRSAPLLTVVCLLAAMAGVVGVGALLLSSGGKSLRLEPPRPRTVDGLSDRQRSTIRVDEVNRPPILEPIEEKTIEEGGTLTFSIRASDPDAPARELAYRLVGSSAEGARVDARSGRFVWEPRVVDAQREYRFVVGVSEVASDGLAAQQAFTVRVRPDAWTVQQLCNRLRLHLDEEVVESRRTIDSPIFALPAKVVRVGQEAVFAFYYESAESAEQEMAQVGPDATTIYAGPRGWSTDTCFFRKERLVVVYGGSDRGVLGGLYAVLGEPFAVGRAGTSAKNSGDKDDDGDPAIQAKQANPPFNERLVELHRERKLFLPSSYPVLRRIYAEWFEFLNRDVIQRAYPPDDQQMAQWLDAHREVKEELYTAIHPRYDDVAAVLSLFGRLRERFPEKIAAYGELAIATAVCWDRPAGGVYDYGRHQQRTKSIMPEEHLGAVENFQYLLDTEDSLEGRTRMLPWEFLVHVVNHKTPTEERRWVLDNYVTSRTMLGRCYDHVPYDKEMLRTQSKIARLNGKAYTLPNLRRFGGVCAMRADFASRVGKSLGVPAAYVRGEGAQGIHHAWVMWVELLGVTNRGIDFGLQSYGRYFYDKYYVGHLRDPHTGREITDRQLELELHTVGADPQSKRHADLIMRAYPMLREKTEMDVTEQLIFLHRVIGLSPGNQVAWRALAKMSRDGVVTEKHSKAMTSVLEKLFTTFAAYPDFTWSVFDDLIAFKRSAQQRRDLFARLITLYESAGRPDLACKARLRLCDYLLEEKRHLDAIEGLAFTIRKFPGEGRYVPAMLDRLEEICGEVTGFEDDLLQFYRDYLPKIPQMRGDMPSPFCIEMFQRAVDRFRSAGDERWERLCEVQLAKLRAGFEQRPR